MTGLTPKKLSLPLAIVLLCAIPFLIARTASAPVTGTPILEIHAAPLTDYLASGTGVQDLLPRHEQRGVHLDGSLRAASTFPMHLNGNPFGSPWNANQVLSDISLATGTYAPLEIDLSIPADGARWVIGRTYNARQDDGGNHHDASSAQGWNWAQSSQPEIVLYEHASDDAEDIIYLIYGADRFV